MKAFMWTTLKPHKIKNTLWEQIDDTLINIDIDQTELLFKAKQRVVHKQQNNE